MTSDVIVDIFRSALQLIILVIAVVITPGLLVGIVISFFQAATQINDQSLSFMPKLIVTFLVLMLAGSWIMRKITDYTTDLMHNALYLIS